MKKVIMLTCLVSMTLSVAASVPKTARDVYRTDNILMAAKAKPYNPLMPVRPRQTQLSAHGLSSIATNPVRKANRHTKVSHSARLSDGLQLRGSVVSTWSFMRFPGYYNIPYSADCEFEQLGGIIAEYGAWDDGEGKMYVAGMQDWGMGYVIPELYVYSTDTWEEIDYPECDFTIIGTDNATDPTTGDVYGCYYDEDYENLTWAKAEYTSGRSRAIKTLAEDERMYGVACDASGQYYAMLANGNFVKVDKTTGEYSVVSKTDLRPYYSTSATFDDKSGTFIFSYAPAAGMSSLWAIDAATGTTSLLIDYADNDQITALSVVKPAAENLAPAAPMLEADAPAGGKDISYTITMPSTHFDGSPAQGQLSWSLLVDGVAVNQGTAECGSTVTGNYIVTADGPHSLVAYAENEVGRSPGAKLTVVIGAGVPMAPGNPGINNFGGGYVSLYWDAVKGSVDGAYVDPEEITYTISRNGIVVAQGITDTYYDETVDVPDTYMKLTYEISAVYAGNTSEAAKVSTGVGHITPPYASSFATEPYDDGLYTSVNSNNDNVEWYFSQYYGCFKYDYCDNAGDDWLISPAFHLEAGKIYELSYSIAAGHSMYTERYSLAMGVAPTAAAMVTTLVEPTILTGDLSTPQVKTVTVKAATGGDYYIGWHALSDPSQFMIQVKDIRMSAGMIEGSPSEATDIVLERNVTGYLRLNGSFKAPATDISGNELKSLGKIVVTRKDKTEPVATFEQVTPGATLTFEDNDIPTMGTYTYAITAWGIDGNIGRETLASAYVGPKAPANIPVVNLVEGNTPGTVVLSWKEPKYDVDGQRLDPANLTYMVYVQGDYNQAVPVLDEPITACEAKFKVCEPDQMEFAIFYVEALNLGLESEGLTRSDMVPVGKAETLPYTYSFDSNDRATHLLGYIVPSGNGGYVEIGNQAGEGVPAQDGDDAFIKLYNPGQHTTIEFFTGKISLAGAANPAVSLYYYKWADSDTNLTEVVAVDRDGNSTLIGSADNATTGNVGWNLLVCPLDLVKNKDVKIVVNATANSHSTMLYDNIRVADRHPIDLSATSLSAPLRVEVDKPFTVTAGIANMGTDKVDVYTVELLLNDNVVATATDVPALKSGGQTIVEFKQTLSPLTQGKLEYTARVTVNGDGDTSNDISPIATPELVVSKFPYVNDLEASRTESGIKLTWSAPATNGFEAKDVEDFEEATAWTEEVEGWTMIDRDGKQIGTLEGAGMPDAVGMRTSHSFFIFDSDSDDILFYNPELAYLVQGNSGSKSLVAMYILPKDTDQDDWAISPLLSGEAQTISFYARSFHPEYLDHMEVLYTTEDSTDPNDYVTLCPDGSIEVPQLVDALGNAAYKQYEFELPQGARYFAIRAHNSGGNGFMLMIDDVKFRPANATLEIVGYDIYRDGIKINTEAITSPSYTDTEADGTVHTYNVIVNYNRGLSPVSNTVLVEALGLNDNVAGGINVTVDNRIISITGATDGMAVRLYAADGRQLYAGSGDCRIAAQPGTYVLSIGALHTKVVVK